MKPKNLLLERVLAKMILERFELTQLEVYEDKYPDETVHRYFYYSDGLPPPKLSEEKYLFNEKTYVSIHIFENKSIAQSAIDEFKKESYLRWVPSII